MPWLPPPPPNISPWHSKQAIHVQHCGFCVKCPLKGLGSQNWLSPVVRRWAWVKMRSPISSVGWLRDGVIQFHVVLEWWQNLEGGLWARGVVGHWGRLLKETSCAWSLQFCLLCFQAAIRHAAVPCHALPRWSCQRFCLSTRLKAKETTNPELESLKTWSKTKPSHLDLPDSLSR